MDNWPPKYDWPLRFIEAYEQTKRNHSLYWAFHYATDAANRPGLYAIEHAQYADAKTLDNEDDTGEPEPTADPNKTGITQREFVHASVYAQYSAITAGPEQAYEAANLYTDYYHTRFKSDQRFS